VFHIVTEKTHKVTCRGCGEVSIWDDAFIQKMLNARQNACLSCGGSLRFPRELDDLFRRALWGKGTAQALCPGCDRAIPAMNLQRANPRCQYCGMSFLPPWGASSVPRMGPLGQGELASREGVAQAGTTLATTPRNRLLINAMSARAKLGEVLEPEPELIFNAMRGLDQWDKQRAFPFLPLPAAEVEDALPPVFFGSSNAFLEEKSGFREVVITVKLGDERKDEVSGADVRFVMENIIGLGALATTGAGFVAGPSYLHKDNILRTTVQHRVRVGLYPQEDGTRLTFAQQVDQDKPRALDASQSRRVGEKIWQKKAVFRAYYTMLALYGPGARGMPALRITGPALEKRLRQLGCPKEAIPGIAGELLFELRARKGKKSPDQDSRP